MTFQLLHKIHATLHLKFFSHLRNVNYLIPAPRHQFFKNHLKTEIASNKGRGNKISDNYGEALRLPFDTKQTTELRKIIAFNGNDKEKCWTDRTKYYTKAERR